MGTTRIANTLLFAFLTAVAVQAADATTLIVAPEGNDGWSGRLERANAEGTDGPLASLEGARNTIRGLRATGAHERPLVVEFRPGTYRFTGPVEFGPEDSGTATAPVTYRAAKIGRVHFSGGGEVVDWKPVTDPNVLERLPESARAQVRVADLRARGLTDFGVLQVRGFGEPRRPAEAELFAGDKPMTLARWPNSGFRGVVSRKDAETLEVDTDRLTRWTAEKEPWVFAYWHHDWAELYEPIQGLDPAKRILRRSGEIRPRYGVTAGRARWYAFNLLSEIDQPGEYYLDRSDGRLYFWPPDPEDRVVLSLADGFIRARDLSHVVFEGFTFEICRGKAITLTGGERCRIVGCTVRNTGCEAVQVTGGRKHQVFGCDVHDTGEGGIFMTGGDRPTLTPAGHNVVNNHVHHYARRARTYRPAISVGGVGNRIAHNLIHDGPHMALSAGGNDHVIEFNEIHNVVEDSGDAGAYYVGRDWTQRGNVLRYNYWHQILGSTGYGGMTIYLDDQHCGHRIYGNVFERCSQAVFIGGGDDNLVTNNLFLECWRAAHLDNRGMGWQKAATDDPKGTLRTRYAAMPTESELWRTRYPNLRLSFEDEPNIPKRNVFARNISVGGVWNHITASIRAHQTIENNLVFDDNPGWARLVKDQNGRLVRVEFNDPDAVQAIGFAPLPVESIGVYAHPKRASWPVRHEVRPVTLPNKP
jgi:hypothetical protein